MNESSSDRLFDEVADIEIDPYTQKILQQAHELEAFLNHDEYKDGEELTQLTLVDLGRGALEEMNNQCPHNHQEVFVTGTILRSNYNEINEEFEVIPVPMDHEQVTSNGFSVLSLKSGESGEERLIVGHLFLLGELAPENSGYELVDSIQRFFGFAPVGGVDIDYEQPDASAIEYLQKHASELLDEVDILIGNSEDECSALMSLRHMTIGPEADYPSETLSKLLSYAATRLDLDEEVPYEVLLQGMYFDGPCTSDNHSIKYFRDLPAQALVYPESLTLVQYPIMANRQVQLSDDMHWAIDFRVIGIKTGDPDHRITIPVRNVRYMASVRKAAYNQ